MKTNIRKNLRNVWLVLVTPPFIFLLIIIAASIYFGIVTQGDADAIAESVPRSMPVILLLVQATLLFMLAVVLKAEKLRFSDIGWRLQEGQKLWFEMLIGSTLGVSIGFLYPYVLAPMLEYAQRTAGDYVPPGEILPALGSYAILFFIANVLLAPFVEESLYRGYAITRLHQHYKAIYAILITSIFFGILHWAGGLWYMILTGGFLGVILAALFAWRKNVIVPFMLHLALNIIEFIFIMQIM